MYSCHGAPTLGLLGAMCRLHTFRSHGAVLGLSYPKRLFDTGLVTSSTALSTTGKKMGGGETRFYPHHQQHPVQNFAFEC